MMHDISIYDTGRNYNTFFSDKRNDGWFFFSGFAGMVLAVIGTIMLLSALVDPSIPLGVGVAGSLMDLVAGLNMLMFLTHRNFGLDSKQTRVMDALYTLPKKKRNEYDISRQQVKLLSNDEASQLVFAISEYRTTTPQRSSLLGLTRDLEDVNKTTREIEG